MGKKRIFKTKRFKVSQLVVLDGKAINNDTRDEMYRINSSSGPLFGFWEDIYLYKPKQIYKITLKKSYIAAIKNPPELLNFENEYIRGLEWMFRPLTLKEMREYKSSR